MPDAATATTMDRGRATWPFWLVLAIGVALRLPRPPLPALWNDEAWRAIVISESPSLPALLETTGAYGGWMLLGDWALGRIGLALLGDGPLAFRLWPFLAGVACIPLAWSLVRRIAGDGAALFAAALIAVGPGFVLFSREFKPFAADLALCLLVLRLAVGARTVRSEVGLCAALCLHALGSLSFAFVHPAVVLYRVIHRGRRGVREWALLALPAALFVAYGVGLLLPQRRGLARVQALWDEAYPTSVAGAVDAFLRMPTFLDLFVPLGAAVVGLAYFVAMPLVSWARRDGVAWLLGVPFAVHFAASALELYPLFGRTAYYLYGLMAVSLAYAGGHLVARLRGRLGTSGRRALALALVVAGVAVVVTRDVRDPYYVPTRPVRDIVGAIGAAASWPPDMGRRALVALDDRYRPGDSVLVGPHMAYTFTHHKARWLPGLPALAPLDLTAVNRRLMLQDRTSERLCRSYAERASERAIGPRLWLLASMNYRPEVYEDVFTRAGVVDFVVRERNQGLIGVRLEDPATPPPCLGGDPLESFELASDGASDGAWDRRRFRVEHFPSYFQLHLGVETEAPWSEWELVVRLLGEDDRPIAESRVDPSHRHRGWLRLTERDWPLDDPFDAAGVRALEFGLRAAGGRPVQLKVVDPAVR